MIFVHVPKTGGSWMTQAVRSAGVPTWAPDPLGDRSYSEHGHADLRDVGVNDRFSVAFVRHPLDWWRSYWGHRMRAGWDPTNGLDDTVASDDFNDFALKVVDRSPGSFDQLVQRFVGLPSPNVDFVGRFEHLVDDACEALRLAGEPFSADGIRQQPRENANDYSRFPALYRPDVAARLAESEHQTIERFYADNPIPANLILDTDVEQPPACSECAAPSVSAASQDLQRAGERVRTLERALSLSRGAEAELEVALAQAQKERDRAAQALSSLRASHLVRYTRTLRVAYYRARNPRSSLVAAPVAQLERSTGAFASRERDLVPGE